MSEREPVQTIQLTSKSIKAEWALSQLMFWGGWVLFFGWHTAFGVLLVILSIPLWISARVKRFWHHS